MTGDNQQSLKDCDNELSKISKWIESNKLDSNVRFLISYAVIKSCGTIEHVLKSVMYENLIGSASEETKTYLQKQILDSSFNPTADRIQQLLGSMSEVWNKSFADLIKGTDDKGKLRSLVNLRNDFAHGSNVITTINEVIEYYNSAKKILNYVDAIMSA